MELVPTASTVVLKRATPPLRVVLPMLAPFDRKVTVPIGVPAIADLTVAVKRAGWP